MEIDDSAWPELHEELAGLDLPASDVQLVVTHLRDRLVGHFGAEVFDVWRAKEGLHRHTADEVATVAVIKLAVLLQQLPAEAIAQAAAEGELASPVHFPWDESFPFG